MCENLRLIPKARQLSSFLRNNGWTQGTHARDKMGLPVGINNDTGVSFCLMGACARVEGKFYGELLNKMDKFFLSTKNIDSISFNDHSTTTKAKVLQALDEFMLDLIG